MRLCWSHPVATDDAGHEFFGTTRLAPSAIHKISPQKCNRYKNTHQFA
jgi:hypothetical protein